MEAEAEASPDWVGTAEPDSMSDEGETSEAEAEGSAEGEAEPEASGTDVGCPSLTAVLGSVS